MAMNISKVKLWQPEQVLRDNFQAHVTLVTDEGHWHMRVSLDNVATYSFAQAVATRHGAEFIVGDELAEWAANVRATLAGNPLLGCLP